MKLSFFRNEHLYLSAFSGQLIPLALRADQLFLTGKTMKKFLSMLAVVVTIGLSSAPMDADAAKRMGAGKSLGMQRQAATPNKAPTATPAQTSAATPAAGAAPAAAAAAAPKRSWMGPLAGLAAGLGLAALASHLGLGGELASMLMFGLLAAAVMVGVGFFMRKRAAARQQAGGNTVGGMQYAGAGAPADVPTTPVADSNSVFKTAVPASAVGSAIGSGIGSSIGSGLSSPVASPSIPADFDTAGFVRNAKVNFIRLQAANDAGNLDDIRQFTTPEMFAQLKMDLSERGAAAQQTDVVSIDGNVFEVVEENGQYVVSVRFTGLIREEASAPSESFDEVWHLTKPLQGNGGWVLSGIQQM
jgi:predicted lipid-binding transport protein (Tim44 family)